MESNERDAVVFNQPKDSSNRQRVARICCRKLNLSIPCVVDTIDNSVDDLYAAWPERIFVIEPDGRVAYAGQKGPWGFKPEAAELSLQRLLKRQNRFSARLRNRP